MSERIVVGYDGSDDAADAVRWAAAQAARTGAALDVVHSYDFPYLEHLDIDTQQTLYDAAQPVAQAGAEVATAAAPGITVTHRSVVGEPGHALLQAAEGAALLVVGHRGASRAHHWLLGSVADKCVRHAPCPVVVVRHG